MKSGAEAAGRKGSSCLAHSRPWVLSLQEREEEGREEAREEKGGKEEAMKIPTGKRWGSKIKGLKPA